MSSPVFNTVKQELIILIVQSFSQPPLTTQSNILTGRGDLKPLTGFGVILSL